MPALVDTTIRLLSQEPLAGRMPTADLLRLAETLDGAKVGWRPKTRTATIKTQ